MTKLLIFIHLFSLMIIKTPLFENISLVVIVANSFVMIFDTDSVDPAPFFVIAD